jgi:hypothetical protein
MKYDKRIVTHKWGENEEYTSSNGYVISAGTYNKSLKFFMELMREARKDFPGLKLSDIQPFIITASTYNKGFAGITFSLPKNTKKDGYRQDKNIDFSFN